MIKLEDYSEAEKQAHEALEFARTNNYQYSSFYSKINNLFAKIYQKKGEDAKVEYYFKEAIKYFNEAEIKVGYTDILVSYGKYLITRNNAKKGLFYCQSAIDIANASNKKNTIEKMITCHECLELAYKKIGDYKNTYFHANKAMILRDSFINKENIIRLTEASVSYKYEAEKLKDSIKINGLQLGLTKNSLALERKKNTVTFLLLLSAFATILFILFFYKFNLKQNFNIELTKLNNALKIKTTTLNNAIIEIRQSNDILNNQLSQNVIFLSHKNTLIDQVMNYAKKIEAPALKKEILTLLRQNQNEADFQELNIQLENSNRFFLQALSSKYPTLSSTELSLCIYLKMNMSNKGNCSINFKNRQYNTNCTL